MNLSFQKNDSEMAFPSRSDIEENVEVAQEIDNDRDSTWLGIILVAPQAWNSHGDNMFQLFQWFSPWSVVTNKHWGGFCNLKESWIGGHQALRPISKWRTHIWGCCKRREASIYCLLSGWRSRFFNQSDPIDPDLQSFQDLSHSLPFHRVQRNGDLVEKN